MPRPALLTPSRVTDGRDGQVVVSLPAFLRFEERLMFFPSSSRILDQTNNLRCLKIIKSHRDGNLNAKETSLFPMKIGIDPSKLLEICFLARQRMGIPYLFPSKETHRFDIKVKGLNTSCEFPKRFEGCREYWLAGVCCEEQDDIREKPEAAEQDNQHQSTHDHLSLRHWPRCMQ